MISHADGSLSKGFEVDPFPSGVLEENFEGGISETFFSKLSDLLTKLPNLFEGHLVLRRATLENAEVHGFETKLFCFEKVKNQNSYSHLKALISEIGMDGQSLSSPPEPFIRQSQA